MFSRLWKFGIYYQIKIDCFRFISWFIMERFESGRLESVDMFADSGENVANGDEEGMFDEGDELELLKALEQTGEFNNEMEFEEEVRLTQFEYVHDLSMFSVLPLPPSRHPTGDLARV